MPSSRTSAWIIHASSSSLVGLHQTRRKIFNFDEIARRAETLEAVDQLVTFLSPAYHHGR
jgi:hypothetical protein